MIRKDFEANRALHTIEYHTELCVVGGGLAGVCCAITAARLGVRTVLVQDRPVLGGNASSEVRLWALGATSHMNNNNRWAREGGVIDEILVENRYRNREGNPLYFDALLLEKVAQESNITLLLNTVVYDLQREDREAVSEGARIDAVTAYCSQNESRYRIAARLYCDASGDGIVGYLAGAPFRYGAEPPEQFGEAFAPDPKEYGELLGHSIFFYTKDTGTPVQFTPPSFALGDPELKIPRFRNFNVNDQGCQYWWIEYGGRLDTIHDTEKIKWELWKIIYGVWDRIKNSGQFPGSENLTLEWMGAIPGKRESRRFEGIRTLTQLDIVEQRQHEDAVSFGGWSIDLHPADGIYSPRRPCDQYHAAGIYQIPYSVMVPREVSNLFLAGRIISASHVAFGSTRVMATCAHGAQAVGAAASICLKQGIGPAAVGRKPHVGELQRLLAEHGQYIPGYRLKSDGDLARSANVSASGSLVLGRLPASRDIRIDLDFDRAQMLPVPAGPVSDIAFVVDVARSCFLEVELRATSKPGNFTPDRILESLRLSLGPGERQLLKVSFTTEIEADQYLFVCFRRNDSVRFHAHDGRITGLLALRHSGDQDPPGDAGIDGFELWTPDRRPDGHLFAFSIEGSPVRAFEPTNVVNGFQRPTFAPNAWVAPLDKDRSELQLTWEREVDLSEIVLVFDTDFDNAMETVLRGHPDRAMPCCVRDYELLSDGGEVIYRGSDNHQSINRIRLSSPCSTLSLTFRAHSTWGDAPPALFEIRCYE
ncbi:FAD-dependent oxidoreductase [Salinispira pacifica]